MISPVPAAPRTARRRWLFRVGAIVVGLAIFPGIPEVLVRVAQPKSLDGFRAVYFGGDARSPELFVNDPALSWRLRPSVSFLLLDVTVETDQHGFRRSPRSATEAHEGERRILCLGDSTPFGWKTPASQIFPELLAMQLDGRASSLPPWKLLNAAVPGYSSYQARLQAEELIPRWRPALVVVCVGNNDAWPVERSDREAIAATSSWSRQFLRLARHSHLALWIKDLAAPSEPPPLVLPSLDRATQRVSLDEYRENLAAIVRVAREHDARVAIVASPANLYHAPVRGDQFPGFAELQRDSREVAERLGRGDQAAALRRLAELRQRHPDDFRYQWLEGMVVSKLGEVERGRELLEQALEADPFPECCKRSYREAAMELARAEELIAIDPNEIFARAAAPASPESFYLDWCHPTPLGHRLIAAELARQLGEIQK